MLNKNNFRQFYKSIMVLFISMLLVFKALENFNQFAEAFKASFNSIIGILSPFIWGLVLSFLLTPISNIIENNLLKNRIMKRKKSIVRALSIFLSMFFALLIILLVFYGSISLISGNITKISFDSIQSTLYNSSKNILNTLQNIEEPLTNLGLPNDIVLLLSNYAHSFYNIAFSTIQTQLGNAIIWTKNILITFINFFFGLVFAYNMMFNKEYFIKLYQNIAHFILPKSLWSGFSSLSSSFYEVLRHFVRALFIDLSLISLVTFISLLIIGEKYAFLTGIFAGYTNIIPYLGTWLGIIPAVLVALVTKGVKQAIFVGIYIVVIQQIYIVIVSPKVKGDTMGVHPLFVLLSFFVFGTLFGLWGTILALPIAGIIKVIFTHWVKYTSKKRQIKWE